MARAFPSYTGLLDAAERRGLRGHTTRVDANHAIFQRFSDAPDPLEIGRVEVGCQAVDCIVGLTDYVIGIFEAKQRCKRSERLFLSHTHVLGHVGKPSA